MNGGVPRVRRTRTAPRLRAFGAAVIFALATFAVDAAPVSLPGPLGDALGPEPALAGYCASNPNFTGRLTGSSGSTTAISRTTSPNVFGYVSNVAATWSCTAYFRYSGIAWNTAATTGSFQWGNLINSGAVACNFVVGSTDYIKGNSTADCSDSDAEYALPATLDAERVYQRDVAHDSIGDISYVHSDCASYYGSAPLKTGQTFSTGITGNRPEPNNCDPIALDDTATAQTITYDATPPALDFTTPNESTTTYRNAANPFNVVDTATEAVAGFAAPNDWELQRQIATATAGSCGSFASDAASGNLTTGTSTGSISTAQTLVNGKCYRWLLNATDQNSNAAPTRTSGTVIYDTTNPATNFSTPNEGTTTNQNTASYSVAWAETDAGSGVLTRSLQRKKAAWTSGSCSGLTFSSDGLADTSTSPVAATMASGFCYYWVQTLVDRAGNSSQLNSGYVTYNAASPSANFTTPNEGTCAYQNTTGYSVAWTETAGSGSITARSLQRQVVAIGTPGLCTGTFANDGSPSTSASPASSTLTTGGCYRWVQTLTNSAGKVGISTSGVVCADTGAPAGSISSSAAYVPAAGDIVITGSATDALSFMNYQLEYGAGASPAAWTTIGTFTSPVVATNPLGTWSTGTLNGIYTVRLTIRDFAGNTLVPGTRQYYLENGERGEESYQTRIPFDLGGDWGLDIGVSNGEARLDRELFTIPSYGPPQALSLSYSSLESGTAGKFGTGWTSNLTQYLTFDAATYATQKFIVWHRPDGGLVPFGLSNGMWGSMAGHFETVSHSGSETTITLKDQTRVVFEDASGGRLKRIENRFGKALTLVWNSSSATATDASGRVTTLAIDSVNNTITAATDSAGRAWGFGYTGTDLTSVTDPGSKVTTLAYASHLLTSVSRSRSRVVGAPETVIWTVGYTSGKTTTLTDPVDASASNTFSYNAGSTSVGLLRAYSPPDWNTTTYTYDSLGRVTSFVDPAAFTTSTTYDADSNALTRTEAVSDTATTTTTWTYDSRGNPLTQSRPIDATTSVTTLMTYSGYNDSLIASEADNDSAVKLITKNVYDGSGHMTSSNLNCTTTGTTPPASASTCTGAGTQDSATNLITTFAYTANDQLDTETDPLGRVTKHAYDTYGNETTVTQNYISGQSATAERNVATATAFDQLITAGKAGLATSATDPVGNSTTFTYDALGRRLTEVLPGDSSVPVLTQTITFDEFGNTLTSSESWTPLGGGATVNRTTTYVYELANRESSVTDPAGVLTSTTYDAAGDPVNTIAGGVQTQRTFDHLSQATTEVIDSVGVTNHDFDPQGNETYTGGSSGVDVNRTYAFDGREMSQTVDALGAALDTVHSYDLLGRELTTTDPESVQTVTTYDRIGRVKTVALDGGTTTFGYDRAGNQVSVTDPLGIVTTTTFDALNRPTASIVNDVASPTLPTQDVTTTTWYDAAGTTVAVTDPKGVSLRAIPNVRGMTKQTIVDCTDSGTTPTTNPPACTGAGTHNSTTNIVTTVLFDGSGPAIQTISAVGTGAEATTESAFDANGRVQAVKDPLGTISRTFYTGGNATKVVVNCTTSGTTIPTDWANCTGGGTADGTWNLTTTYVYDNRGNRITETAPNGRVTTSGYDYADRPIGTIANDVVTPTLPTDDVTTSSFYDAAGRVAARKAPLADGSTFAITRYVYDDNGTLAREIRNCTLVTPDDDPALCGGTDGTALGTLDAATNVVTDYFYDARGNQVKVVAASPAATSGTDSTTLVTSRLAYDKDNRLCRVVENSTQSDATWAGLADRCSTAISGTTTTNVSTRYTYDGAGNRASMIDANGGTTTYGYDAASRMTSITDPLNKTVGYVYNDLGQEIREDNRTDYPATNSISWTYDGAGQILTRNANAAATTYTYDPNGNKLTAAAGSFTITATYDRLNRPLTVDDEDAGPTADTTYTYSLTSPSWTDPTGTYLVALDAFDHPTSVDGPAITAITTSYRADGQPASQAAPNGNTTTFAYDAVARETARSTTAAGPVTRAAYSLAYNRAGQILTESTQVTGDPTNGTTTYAYDPLERLASYTRASSTTAYGWDEVPNRTSVQVGANPAVTTTFDGANRPTSDSAGGTYTSDFDGRLTARPGQRFEWDNLRRLTKVKPPTGSGTIADYSYDPLDRLRLVDYGGSNRNRFRYVGLTTSVAQIIDDQSGSVLRHVGTGWGGERLLDWTGTNSNIRYYGTNAHHDTTWTGSSTGTVSATLRYDPWGTIATSTGSSLPDFRFQGSWYDTTTDLSWVIARWYAPSLGRFVSEDSLLGTPSDPPSRHLFTYAGGEPVGQWDPDGNAWRRRIIFELQVIVCTGNTFGGRLIFNAAWAQAFTSCIGIQWINRVRTVTDIDVCGWDFVGLCMGGWHTLKRTVVDSNVLKAIQWTPVIVANAPRGSLYRVHTVHLAILDDGSAIRGVTGHEFR